MVELGGRPWYRRADELLRGPALPQEFLRGSIMNVINSSAYNNNSWGTHLDQVVVLQVLRLRVDYRLA